MRNKSIETRINKVISGLQVKTSCNDKFRKSTVAERMTELNIPGISITVINDGVIDWTRGFGVKKFGNNHKIDENSMFLAGSVSKPIFALTVMKLKEKGLIDLDRDVNDYLKSWKVPKIGNWQPSITLRQILSHSAGLTVHGFLGYLKSEKIPSIQEILSGKMPANSPKVEVNILPGTQFRYSGGGTTIAQLAIEEYFNKPFYKIIEDELFEPLKLKNSTYNQSIPASKKKQLVTGHPHKNQPIVGGHHIYPEMAAAGLWSTTEDLAKITIELQKATKGNSTFIKMETIEEMLTPPKFSPYYCLGFQIEGEKENRRFFHGGWDEGFVSYLGSYQHESKGAIIMVNSNEGFQIMDEILKSIAKVYKWKKFLPKKRKNSKITENSLENYIGSFTSENDVHFKVLKQNKKLYFQVENQQPLVLSSENKKNFYINGLNTNITFNFSKNGEVENLEIKQENSKIIAMKNE